MTRRPPESFPYLADYVDQFPVGGGGHVTARQRVRVLERFGTRYRIQAIENLRIPGINRDLHDGETFDVKRRHIVPIDAGEVE